MSRLFSGKIIMNIHQKLIDIQSELVAPKTLRNSFGNYNYRSCESVLEALKPHLKKHGLTLTITDDVVCIGERIYVKATAKLTDSDDKENIEVSAFARESLDKKGMDDSQITGATSSYARKYALNGMFCIDDTKDADGTNTHGEVEDKKTKPKPDPKPEAISKESLETLQGLLDTLGISSTDYVIELNANHDLGLSSLSELPAGGGWLKYCVSELQKRINAKRKEAA